MRKLACEMVSRVALRMMLKMALVGVPHRRWGVKVFFWRVGVPFIWKVYSYVESGGKSQVNWKVEAYWRCVAFSPMHLIKKHQCGPQIFSHKSTLILVFSFSTLLYQPNQNKIRTLFILNIFKLKYL